MKDLILTGMMGTGKTTVGRILAGRYGLRFVDTDEEIEARAGCSIAEFWAAHAEPAFRALEAEAFRDVLSSGAGGRVIATGAGTLVAESNRVLLGPDQTVICLTCNLDELVTRVGNAAARPLLSGSSTEETRHDLGRRLEDRASTYALFEPVDTSRSSPEEVATAIAHRFDIQRAGRLRYDSQRDSQIVLERGLLGAIGPLLRENGFSGEVVVVTDLGVRRACWPTAALRSLRDAGFSVHHVPINGGEHDKTLSRIEGVYRACGYLELERSSTILGMGGGVVGDMVGFVAATYLRGIRLVLAPTTLLAQVDASIGGKVGVDFNCVKNVVGAFYPADLIVLDPDTLATLPASGLADGLAEMVKIAMVRSASLLNEVESLVSPASILQRPDIIRRAAHEKVRLVEIDPYEQGDRALLNFGHTIGHAIETESAFRLSHGQAISIGMRAETRLAEERGWCLPGLLSRLSAILDHLGLPVSDPILNPRRVRAIMQQDKKRRDGRIRFALPASAGRGIVVEVEENDVQAAIGYAVGGAE